MSMNNSQLAHVWAQQTKPSGKTSNGNFSFYGRSLYSYRTEIARFVDRVRLDGSTEPVVIYTTQKYSVTTTGKHKFYSAIRHIQSFAVNNHMRHVPNDWNEIKILVAYTMSEAIESHINALKKDRSGIDYRLEWISTDVSRLINFIDSNFESRNHRLKGVLDYSVLINLHAERDKTLETYFNIDLTKKLDQQRRHNEAMAIKNEARRLHYAAMNEKHREQNTLTLEEWINGKGTAAYRFNSAPVKLRINENRIETSHGASVPLDEAIMFYELLKSRDAAPLIIMGIKIGEFMLNKIENDIAFIGCHQIPLVEMERVYCLHNNITKPILTDASV